MADETELTHLQKSRIRMEIVIPIVRAMEAELGKERAHELVREALDSATSSEIAATSRGRRFKKMPFNSAGIDASFAAGDALQYDVLREDEEAFDFNVTGCQYKALMAELDAVDLGALLFCDGDFASAEAYGLELTRTQTCMQGAGHCDFRYRLRPDES